MTNEFRKRLKLLHLDEETFNNVWSLIEEVGKQFPCLSCSSKADCANFKWFIKWYGEQS